MRTTLAMAAALAALPTSYFRPAAAFIATSRPGCVASAWRRTGARAAFTGAALSTSGGVAATANAAPLRRAAFTHPSRGPAGSGGGLRMLFGALDPFKRKEMDYDQLICPAAREAAAAALKGEVPATSADGWDILTIAGGCFWGVELRFQRVPGVMATSVGYTQGAVDKPTYGDVCSGSTGHTEAVQIFYDPKVTSVAELMAVFFERVDPTQVDGQGNDWGTQYRTGVYFHAPGQEAAIRQVFEQERARHSRPLASELKPAQVYWPAEEYHQQYLAKGGRFNSPQSPAKNCDDPIRCYG